MEAIDYKKGIEDFKAQKLKSIKVAVLQSYTVQNIDLPLTYYLMQFGFDPTIKYGGYQQFNQELRDPLSWLSQMAPEIIFIASSTKSVLPHIEYEIVSHGYKRAWEMCEGKIAAMLGSISNYRHAAKILLTTFEHLSNSPFGFKDISMEDGLYALIQRCNDMLREYARKNPNVILIDFEKVMGHVGKYQFTDDKMYYIGKILLSSHAAQHLALEVATCINASYGNIKKCIIVDLDNTIWGGVIGEDGPQGIVIGDDTSMGSIYADIQRTLLNYKQHGILLAAVSKNNEADVMPVFENRNMILKKSDFIIMKVNWKPKSHNIQEIAEELSLGVDSFIFLDDNPAERLEVAAALPAIHVVDFPTDVARLPKILNSLPYLKSITLTEEDKKRHELYVQEKNRTALSKQLPMGDYLKELKITIEVKKDDIDSIERITQLINKTNQFNLRTQRYTQEQVVEMMNSEKIAVFSLRTGDKFGDMGLTAVAILKRQGNTYFFDSYLMSCRILARGIEKQFFYEMLKMLPPADEINAEYLATPKNELAKEFYESLGFTLVSQDERRKEYKLDLHTYKPEAVSWIRVIT